MAERFWQHRGNADVVRQDLERELGVVVLRTWSGQGRRRAGSYAHRHGRRYASRRRRSDRCRSTLASSRCRSEASGYGFIHHRGQEVAVHPETAGRRQRLIEPAHFAGIAPQPSTVVPTAATEDAALLRPLDEYERLIGGGW